MDLKELNNRYEEIIQSNRPEEIKTNQLSMLMIYMTKLHLPYETRKMAKDSTSESLAIHVFLVKYLINRLPLFSCKRNIKCF